ncbi:MAG TPA: CDP-diacylglycerol--glycerol-3-phosphate 3-phosphatidyltransferase [Thermodesulfovibrionales bacterium]|nr:CDP-diacylglycerol--glycerol-3-phosphate 3-phosphatidyltransferase [Thermodesulfovibrionales bacterium]
MRLNLPTLLTLSRIVVIPFFVMVTPYNPVLGAIIFSVASVTDFLDGYLARKTGQITTFGIILDPIADKFLVISALILLVDMARLSAWIAIVIIVREFLVTGLRAVALSKDIVIPAEVGGKLKTFCQITAILCLILDVNVFGFDLYDAGIIAIWIALILSVVSGFQYTLSFWKRI